MKKNRVWLFYITIFFYWFSTYAYVPIFTPYIEKSGINYGFVGIIIGSYGFAQMMVRIPLGIISDRLNKRKIFIISGLFFGLISSLGLWFFNGAFFLLLFRSLAGVAASSWVIFSVLFSSYFKSHEAPKAIGFLTSVTAFGQVSATFLGGLFAQWYGDKITFLMAAAAGGTGLVISFFIRENKDIYRKPLSTKQLVSVGKTKTLLVFSGLAVMTQFIGFSTVYGFTPVAAKALGADSYQLGLLTTLSALPGILASALSGTFFSKHLGEKKTLFLGFLFPAITCILIPFISDFWWLVATQMIGGFGRGVVMPLLMGLSIKNVEDSKRASAMGFFQAIYGLGMFGGPAIVGWLGDTAGLNFGFYATGLIGIIAAIGVLLSIPKGRKI